VLNDLLRIGGYDLLVIGGHDYEVPEFLQQLPCELRARVAGAFSVDPGTASRAETCGIAGAIGARYDRERIRQLAAVVLEKVAMGGLATLGLDMCLWADTVGGARLTSSTSLCRYSSTRAAIYHLAAGTRPSDLVMGAELRFPLPPPPGATR
jgi:hypothetical protein